MGQRGPDKVARHLFFSLVEKTQTDFRNSEYA
jgi:hypothetical protein